MYYHKLGVYHMMIVSKYFETIEDHINLELSTPKAKGNMAKFHFNPIPLDRWSRKFWTSLQTLHIYNETDEHFPKQQFYKRIIWYTVDCQLYLKKKKANEIYKNVILDKESVRKYGKIPQGVTRIGQNCFSTNQYYLTNVIIPDSVTSIESCCFQSINRLSDIVLPTSLKCIASGCFQSLPSLKEILIPDSVTYIGQWLFRSCRQLTSVTLSSHFQVAGNAYFDKFAKVLQLTQLPSNVQKINGNHVSEHMEYFEIPSHVTKLDCSCFLNMPFKTIIIPLSVSKISNDCFVDCRQLEKLLIPESIKKIGNNCFHNCVSLKEIEIPSSVTMFGEGLFWNCSSLTSITLHNNYHEVKERDFYKCTSLSSIQLPSSVTEIGEYAFRGCYELSSINLENVKKYRVGCFYETGITKEKYPQLPNYCLSFMNLINFPN